MTDTPHATNTDDEQIVLVDDYDDSYDPDRFADCYDADGYGRDF